MWTSRPDKSVLLSYQFGWSTLIMGCNWAPSQPSTEAVFTRGLCGATSPLSLPRPFHTAVMLHLSLRKPPWLETFPQSLRCSQSGYERGFLRVSEYSTSLWFLVIAFLSYFVGPSFHSNTCDGGMTDECVSVCVPVMHLNLPWTHFTCIYVTNKQKRLTCNIRRIRKSPKTNYCLEPFPKAVGSVHER